MIRLLTAASFFLSFTLSAVAQAAPPKSGDADLSQEAFVVEQFSRKEKFENDGSYVKEDTERVRIQSEAGLKRYSLLTFSYASGTGTFDIDYLRTRKADGTIVETPLDNVQDMPAQITREAPFYSDLHEKHVAVKGLSVGDVLEFKTEEHATKPLAPGQFWTSQQFTRELIVLDERLEISVPKDRAVKVKSKTIQPVITEAGGYRVYNWHSTNLRRKNQADTKKDVKELAQQQVRGRLPQIDVLMSSFATWDDVGRWYGGLQEQRVIPTPDVVAKATELTKNATGDEAKLHALYSYVSTQFHYIGVAFGIGRYQPHTAAEVLANQYGDCKDKHTLFASLITASGMQAYPALISSSREIDEDVPSPGQFDHVITAVPRDGNLIWLDTTAEVGPFQYLFSTLREKHALVIWKDKPASLIETPASPPFPSTQIFNMSAKLSDAGVLEGNANFSVRGDVEYYLRAAFRMVPLPQWNELGQKISYGSGFGGEVSEVTASSPEKTDQPFNFSYKYVRKDFGDWPNHRVPIALPLLSLAGVDEEDLPAGPVWLGTPDESSSHTDMELPSGYLATLPSDVHVKRDFAEFDSIYTFQGGKVIGDRHLKTLMREVPQSEREEYKQLVRAVRNDYNSFIQLSLAPDISATADHLSSIPDTSATANRNNPGFAIMEKMRSLPDSSNHQAAALETEARLALARHDVEGAISSLNRAVAADPKFARAWVLLGGLLIDKKQLDNGVAGGLLLTGKQTEAGIDAFHKAMAADPDERAIPKALGYSLMVATEFEDAILVWQDYIKAHPDDADGPMNLGNCFISLKRYSEAASVYQAAAEKSGGDRNTLQMMTGNAYLHAGDRDKAAAAFTKLAELKPNGGLLNDAAYAMANADLQLPTALEYAKKAVTDNEEESQKITLAGLKVEDLQDVFKLEATWDTLGWVNERMSNMAVAEQYLQAAWKVTQEGVVAGHLCHLYRRTHDTANGIRMCRLAITRLPLSQQIALDDYKVEAAAAEENLHALTQETKTKNADASNIAIAERTFKLPRFLPGTESAEFFVLLTSDGKSKSFKVADTKFISGSDKMKLQGKQLKTIDFKVPAPDPTPARFVRRGILGCYQYSGCSFVLLDPGSVHSIN